MKIQHWIKGLVGAVIGGAATAVTNMIVDPVTFNFNEGAHKLWQVAWVSAVISGCMYLKQSPVPPEDDPKTPVAMLLALLLPFSVVGCAALAPGADPVVVRAEQSIQIAFSTFDTFLKLEHDNSAKVKDKAPEVHQFAEWLREKDASGTSQGIAMIRSADNFKNAYKSNRTAENKANLITILATLESAVSETQKHLTAIK